MSQEYLTSEILEENGGSGTNTLPQFLNVLTILTFIGSGLAVIMSSYYLATLGQQKAQVLETQRLLEGTNSVFGSDFMEVAWLALDNAYLLQGTAIAVALACIYGALSMRKLKKSGYYIYVAASIISVAVPISVLGLMGGLILLGAIFTVAFVIMYGVNLKYLK